MTSSSQEVFDFPKYKPKKLVSTFFFLEITTHRFFSIHKNGCAILYKLVDQRKIKFVESIILILRDFMSTSPKQS